ncbi:MAG: carboxypeptidase-like regulatory domain-containing protein [Flavobacteriales bacterium]|jgi:hypothetical protein|nr:carboxypeptidase-like regulatory domain-containing protein [Flavobacteriales bacterium]
MNNKIQKVNLKELKNCEQSWEQMTEVKGGRLCAKCQNVLIDFRKMSLREIAQVHVFSKDPVCGVYTDFQLRNQENPKEVIKIKWWKAIQNKFTYYGGFFLTNIAFAQEDSLATKPNQVQVSPNEFKKWISVKKPQKTQYIIRGLIKDKNENPLIYANIVLKSSEKLLAGVSTDTLGRFWMDVSTVYSQISDSFVLEISYVGYENKVIPMKKTDFSNSGKLNIALKEENTLISEGLYEELVVNEELINDVSVERFYVVPASDKKKVEKNQEKQTKKKSWLRRFWEWMKNLFSKKKKTPE